MWMYDVFYMDKLESNTKCQAILKTAYDLFWKFGVKRVTIEELCREAGVSKMTFYKFFPNKNELAKRVIDDIFNRSLKQYREIMSSDMPFHEKVQKQVVLKFEGTKELSAEFVKDIYKGQMPELYSYWEKWAGDILNEVLSDYREAQQNGWISKRVNIDFIPIYSTKLFEIVSDEKAVALYGVVQDLIMELINMFFYGILPHDTQE